MIIMKYRKILLLVIMSSVTYLFPRTAGESTLLKSKTTNPKIKLNNKAHGYALGLQAAIILGGIYFWNYSERWTGEFAIENEGWFREDSYNGGADKLGHVYTWSLLTRALIHNYERNGFSRKASAFWGFTIPAVNGVFIELLDGYTTYNASTEDILSNLAGSGLGLFLYLHPKLDETINLSWSYLPSSDFKKNVKPDFTTDYAGQVFTFEVNGNGLRKVLGQQRPLVTDYLQVGLSYYSRGYSGESGTNKQRFMGVTLGINFQQFFKKGSSARTFAKYFQLPYSYGGYYKELNSNKKQFIYGKDIYNY